MALWSNLLANGERPTVRCVGNLTTNNRISNSTVRIAVNVQMYFEPADYGYWLGTGCVIDCTVYVKRGSAGAAAIASGAIRFKEDSYSWRSPTVLSKTFNFDVPSSSQETLYVTYLVAANSQASYLSGSSGYGTFGTPQLLYTNCTAPSSVSSTAIVKPSGNATVSWTQGAGGTNNAFVRYYIQKASRSSSSAAWGAWGSATNYNTFKIGDVSTTDTVSATRGSQTKYRVRTEGSAGESYYSGYREGGLTTVNKLSTVNSLSASKTTVKNAGETVRFSWTGSSNMSGQSVSYRYRLNNGGWTNTSSTQADVFISANTTFEVQAYDNIENGTSRSVYVEVNKKPNDPSITVTGYDAFGEPITNLSVAKKIKVSYSGTDPDGDPLVYTLTREISPTAGFTGDIQRTTIYTNTTTKEYELSLDQSNDNSIPQGYYVRFIVYSSDGLDTSRSIIGDNYFRKNTKLSINGLTFSLDNGYPLTENKNLFENFIDLTWTNPTTINGTNVGLKQIKIERSFSSQNEQFANWVTVGAVADGVTTYKDQTVTDIQRGYYTKYRLTFIDRYDFSSEVLLSNQLRRNAEPIISGPIVVQSDTGIIKPLSQDLNLSWANPANTSDDYIPITAENIKDYYSIKFIINNTDVTFTNDKFTLTSSNDIVNFSMTSANLSAVLNSYIVNNTTFDNFQVYVIFKDSFGIYSKNPNSYQLTSSTVNKLTLDTREKPEMVTDEAQYRIQAYYSNTTTEMIPTSGQPIMMNPGEKIKFIFPPATDKNTQYSGEDIQYYFLKVYSTTLENSISSSIPVVNYSPLKRFNVGETVEYEIPEYDVNTIMSFCIYATDKTALDSNVVKFSGQIECCRRVPPTITLKAIDFNEEDIEDIRRLVGSFEINDIGGSTFNPLRLENGQQMNYTNRRNFERTITGYTPFLNIDLVCSLDKGFSTDPSNTIKRYSIYKSGSNPYDIYVNSINTTETINAKQTWYCRLELYIATGLNSAGSTLQYLQRSNTIILVGAEPLLSFHKGSLGINKENLDSRSALQVNATNENYLIIFEGVSGSQKQYAYFDLNRSELYDAVVNITDNEDFNENLKATIYTKDMAAAVTGEIIIEFYTEDGTLYDNVSWSTTLSPENTSSTYQFGVTLSPDVYTVKTKINSSHYPSGVSDIVEKKFVPGFSENTLSYNASDFDI